MCSIRQHKDPLRCTKIRYAVTTTNAFSSKKATLFELYVNPTMVSLWFYSSVVEHSAAVRVVAGSNPAGTSFCRLQSVRVLCRKQFVFKEKGR